MTQERLMRRVAVLLEQLLTLAEDLKREGVSDASGGSQLRPDSSSMSDMPRVSKSILTPPDAPDWVGP